MTPTIPRTISAMSTLRPPLVTTSGHALGVETICCSPADGGLMWKGTPLAGGGGQAWLVSLPCEAAPTSAGVGEVVGYGGAVGSNPKSEVPPRPARVAGR